jgi:hypothetical protein
MKLVGQLVNWSVSRLAKLVTLVKLVKLVVCHVQSLFVSVMFSVVLRNIIQFMISILESTCK